MSKIYKVITKKELAKIIGGRKRVLYTWHQLLKMHRR